MKKLLLALTFLCTCIGIPAQPLEKGECYQATIRTSAGTIVIRLFNDTPVHRDNFVKLANEGFYEAIIFHRVIKDFMIQCGDPDTQLSLMTVQYGANDAGYKLPAEILPNHHHFIGAVCAAREGDDVNPERKSSGSQFYIVTGMKEMTDSIIGKAEKRLARAGIPAMSEQLKAEYKAKGGAPHLEGGYTVFGTVVKGMDIAEEISGVKTDIYDRPREDIYIKSITVKTVKE